MKHIVDTGNYSTFGYQIAFAKRMSIEALSFAFCLRQCGETSVKIIEILDDYVFDLTEPIASNHSDSFDELFDKIKQQFRLVVAWYAVNYIQDAYGIYEIGDESWQVIGNAIENVTVMNTIDKLNDVITQVVEYGLDRDLNN